MIYYYECKCGYEIPCDVDICEHMVEVPEECDECGTKFSEVEQDKIYNDALTDAMGSYIDYCHDRMKDKI